MTIFKIVHLKIFQNSAEIENNECAINWYTYKLYHVMSWQNISRDKYGSYTDTNG